MTNRSTGSQDEPSAESAQDSAARLPESVADGSSAETTQFEPKSSGSGSTAAGFLTAEGTRAEPLPSAGMAPRDGDSWTISDPGSDLKLRMQDFEILEELGKGAMGSVARALDRRNGREVALKRLLLKDSTRLTLFKSEFRELADLAHPNLATLYELVSDGDTWFLTMELIEGFNFAWYVRMGAHHDAELAEQQGATAPVSRMLRLRHVLGQLVHGLWALHQAGKVHRDIKPANVMVRPDGHVKLLDFGLITDAHSRPGEQGIYGTVPYLSPEQAAGGAASPASDLYSVGVMLYELLTNRPPHRGKLADVLLQIQDTDPPAPSSVASHVPKDLERLCIALMQRDPRARPSVEAVLGMLKVENLQLAAARSATAPEDRIPFVGRYEQLTELRAAFDDLRAGTTQIVLVNGPSGVGKSAMVRRFLDWVESQGAVVLNGRCYERESVPFKAWDSLVDALGRYLSSQPRLDSASLIPRRTAPLLALFPVLERVKALSQAAQIHSLPSDQHELRSQAFTALREMLTRIGDRSPLVLFIDDVQWGDADSAGTHIDMLRPPDAPPLLLVGTVRSEDAEASEYLNTLFELRTKVADPPPLLEISVDPLSQDESIDLALRLFESVDDDAQACAAQIAQEARGNPFFIHELVRNARHAADGKDTAEADQSAVEGERPSLNDVLWSRISRLPEAARRLLEVIAVRGAPIDEQLSFSITECGTAGPNLLAQLRSGLLIRAVRGGADERVACYHDQIRVTVTERMDAETRTAHHRSLADGMIRRSGIDVRKLHSDLVEAATGEIPMAGSGTVSMKGVPAIEELFDVAVHLDAAGDSEQALPFAYAAAKRAHRQYSLEAAERQYRIAERGAVSAVDAVRFHIAVSLGDVLMLRGLYDDAHERFETACTLTDDKLNTMDVLSRRAELYFKHGDPARPVEIYLEALRVGGLPVPPRNGLLCGMHVLKHAAVQGMHTLLPAVFPRRRPAGPDRREALHLRCLNGATLPFIFTRGPLLGLWTHLQDLNISESYPGSHELGRACARHVFLMNFLGKRGRARKYAERSLQIRRDLGDRWGIGQTLGYFGATKMLEADLDGAIQSFREAIAIFEETGDWFEHNLTSVLLALALYRRDELEESAARAELAWRSGAKIGDYQISGISLGPWALATNGQIPADVLGAELSRPRNDDDLFASTMVYAAKGLCFRYSGDHGKAIEFLNQAVAFSRRIGTESMVTAPVNVWRLQALRRHAAAQPEGSPERRELMRQIRKGLRVSRRLARKFPFIGPEVHREAGEYELLNGNRARAFREFEQGLAAAERTGEMHERRLTTERLKELRS